MRSCLSALVFFVTTALLLTGCASLRSTSRDLRPTALNAWAADADSSDRVPAQTRGGAACFFDRFKNPDSFEIQSAENESRAMPEKIRGQRDKIFEYFKSRIDGFVHPKFQAALAGCQDTTCFYEKVYGRSNPARLAYLMFLKTGMAVSASDLVPGVTSRPSEAGAGLVDFLFTDAELSMLIESSESITTSGFSLFVQPSLRTIHKVPSTTLAVADEVRLRKSCGFANGTHVAIQSSCLAANWQSRLIRGDFSARTSTDGGNDVYLHEFGHAVDNNLAGGTEFSAGADWRSYSETLKPSADGVIYYSPTAPAGFVSGYAAISYKEDFAETFANFRLRPAHTRNVATKKFEFIRSKLFQGRDFTIDGIHAEFTAVINAKILDRMNEFLAGCMGRSDTGRTPVLYKSASLTAPEIACIESEAMRVAGEQYRMFQRTYPEGCLQQEGSWVQSMLAPNAENVSKSIGSLEKVRKLGAVRDLMSAALDPKEAFLEFRSAANSKGLYQKSLERNFEKFRTLIAEIEPGLADGELKNYLARYDFELVKNQVQTIVLSRLKTDRATLTNLIESSFQNCVLSARVATPSDLLKREFKPTARPQFQACGRETWTRQLPAVIAVLFQKENMATSARFIEFAVEIAGLDMEAIFRQRAEEEVEKLEKPMLAAAVSRLKLADVRPIPLAKILSVPVLEREDTCRGVVRKYLYDDVFRKSIISSLQTYTQSLLTLEDSFCEEFVGQNEKHRIELETYRNQTAQIISTLAFEMWPKQFPQDGSIFLSPNSPAEVVEPVFQTSCREKLTAVAMNEPRLKTMLAAPLQARLVQNGVVETCLNGRYAGRFIWRPSDRFISFGGIRSLGFAQFDSTQPTGAENRAYLYSLKRYVQMRTAEKTDLRH